jgi:hypothetical protein
MHEKHERRCRHLVASISGHSHSPGKYRRHVLAFARAGESLAHDAVGEIFHRDEIAVRAAPVGTDVVIACVTPKAGFSESPPKTFCNDMAPKAGPIEAAIDDVVGTVNRAYWALVSVSFVSQLLAFSRRRFVRLQATAACGRSKFELNGRRGFSRSPGE